MILYDIVLYYSIVEYSIVYDIIFWRCPSIGGLVLASLYESDRFGPDFCKLPYRIMRRMRAHKHNTTESNRLPWLSALWSIYLPLPTQISGYKQQCV